MNKDMEDVIDDPPQTDDQNTIQEVEAEGESHEVERGTLIISF